MSRVDLAHQEGVAPEAVRAALPRARRRFRAEYERLVRESGLVSFGGVKPALARLRARLRRLDGFLLPTHADACLGLATMTFMAALMLGTPHGGGAPSVSTARPKHAAAATSSSVSPAAVAEPVDGTHANVRTQGGSVTVRLASSTTDATQITANGPPTIRYAPLGAEATIGKDGGGARFTVGSDSHDSRLSGGIEVYDCNRTLLSTAECTILTMGQTAVEAGEAP